MWLSGKGYRMSSKDKITEELELILEQNVDINARRIYLIDDIESDTTRFVIPAIKYLDNKAVKPIELWINSDGGSLESYFAMYDAFRLAKSEIHTIGTGSVCSAAFILLVSGDKRLVTENCIAMHHAPSSFIMGDGRELQAGTKSYKMVADKFYTILAEKTNKDAKWWEKKANTEAMFWMNAAMLLEHGAIDTIL